jgi:hypothetical protein
VSAHAEAVGQDHKSPGFDSLRIVEVSLQHLASVRGKSKLPPLQPRKIADVRRQIGVALKTHAEDLPKDAAVPTTGKNHKHGGQYADHAIRRRFPLLSSFP